jgi:hypothetical protein
LTPKQEAAALALARGASLSEASETSGVGERTIKTWAANLPAFTRRINMLRAEKTSRALGRLSDNMTAAAADTLGYLSRQWKSEMVRLSAARAVLELGPRLRRGDDRSPSFPYSTARHLYADWVRLLQGRVESRIR